MIVIRETSEADIRFLAEVVVAAASLGTVEEIKAGKLEDVVEVMMEICRSDWSLYWYKLALTAEDTETGKPVGCILGYDGARYAEARKKTFAYAEEKLGHPLGECGTETVPGEFYLDSMTILPEYRGLKIGHRLMEALMDRCRKEGHTKFCLLADKDAPRLRNYYASIDFKETEEILFFGHPYIRMVKEF